MLTLPLNVRRHRRAPAAFGLLIKGKYTAIYELTNDHTFLDIVYIGRGSLPAPSEIPKNGCSNGREEKLGCSPQLEKEGCLAPLSNFCLRLCLSASWAWTSVDSALTLRARRISAQFSAYVIYVEDMRGCLEDISNCIPMSVHMSQ